MDLLVIEIRGSYKSPHLAIRWAHELPNGERGRLYINGGGAASGSCNGRIVSSLADQAGTLLDAGWANKT